MQTLAERRRELARAEAKAQALVYLRRHPEAQAGPCPLAGWHGHMAGRPAAWSRFLR